VKQEYIDWFLNTDRPILGSHNLLDRKYSYTNFRVHEVPFHKELKEYIFSLHLFNDTYYELYHIHTWNEGDFFDEHIDNNFGRKWAYVCELKPSDCGTSLLVQGKEFKEGVFDSNTIHSLSPIKKGTRISLTVFGSPIKTLV
jgi:hypothetical protein